MLRRSALAVVLLLMWVGPLVGAVAVGEALTGAGHDDLGGIAFVTLTICLGTSAIFTLPTLAMVTGRDGKVLDDSVEGLIAALVVVGIVMWFCAFVIALNLPAWYLDHHGVETDALISAEHCDGGQGPVCEQDLRVSSPSGQDLGWVGCNGTGHWHVGEWVRVRVDPDGWAAPQIANCTRAGFLDTMIPVTLGVSGIAFAAAAAAPLIAAHGRDKEEPVGDSAVEDSVVEDSVVEEDIAEPEDAVPSGPSPEPPGAQ